MLSLRSDGLVLGIETSCDDTAAALYCRSRGLVWDKALTQDCSHAPYGGVVPEIASRDHSSRLLPLVEEAVSRNGGKPPAAIACTAGPGLPGSLAAGVALAQSLAYAWQVPLAQVNHLEGHLLSPLIESEEGFSLPYLALLASGGHTVLAEVRAVGEYRVLGETLDDAAGEAFDKTGTLLGLPFPGGAALEGLAAKGDPGACPIPAAMRGRKDMAMSFSGLKTAARLLVIEGHDKKDVAAAFQRAAVETLAGKADLALEATGLRRVALVGGVARNAALQRRIGEVAASHGASAHAVPARWCTDNAAMIALAGAHRLQPGYSVRIRPRWPLSELN